MTLLVIFDERFFDKGAELQYEQNYLQNHDNSDKIFFHDDYICGKGCSRLKLAKHISCFLFPVKQVFKVFCFE